MDTLGTYIFLGLGILACINAVIMMVLAAFHRMRAQPVNVEVIDLRQTSDTDDGIAFAPVFRVVDGMYAGEQWASRSTSKPPVHAVGDQFVGTYDRRTGVIQSGPTRRGNYVVAFAMLFGSIACFYISQMI